MEKDYGHSLKVSPRKIFIYYKGNSDSGVEKPVKCHLNRVTTRCPAPSEGQADAAAPQEGAPGEGPSPQKRQPRTDPGRPRGSSRAQGATDMGNLNTAVTRAFSC